MGSDDERSEQFEADDSALDDDPADELAMDEASESPAAERPPRLDNQGTAALAEPLGRTG